MLISDLVSLVSWIIATHPLDTVPVYCRLNCPTELSGTYLQLNEAANVLQVSFPRRAVWYLFTGERTGSIVARESFLASVPPEQKTHVHLELWSSQADCTSDQCCCKHTAGAWPVLSMMKLIDLDRLYRLHEVWWNPLFGSRFLTICWDSLFGQKPQLVNTSRTGMWALPLEVNWQCSLDTETDHESAVWTLKTDPGSTCSSNRGHRIQYEVSQC